MDVAVPEETLRKIFRAKKTMKVSDRKQLEFLHTSLSSPRSVPSQPPQGIVHVKLSEDAVSMEVDDEIHGATHATNPTAPSLTTKSLTTETCKRKSPSMVASSQKTYVKELSENETKGDKESIQPSLEGVENMNGIIKGHRNPMQDVIPGYHVTSDRADELIEKDIVEMEICLLPVYTQGTVPILDPASCPLLSPNTAVQSASSPSLSPTHTAEIDPDVKPGFLVLSEDDDVQDESDEENDEEQCENEDRCGETMEVNMKKPEQSESGAPVDCSFPSSPLHLQIDEDVESNGALQGKQTLFVDSEDCGQELGERDLDMVETPHKRPRIDCEELETHVEIKISGCTDKQSRLKKVVQQLVDEHLRVLQITLFDQSLQELRDRMDHIDQQQRLHSNLKRLQAKFDRLSKKVGTANQAKENPDKTSEVLLPSACTDATATSTSSATAAVAPPASAPASTTASAPASTTASAPASTTASAPASTTDAAAASTTDAAAASTTDAAAASTTDAGPASTTDAAVASTTASAVVGLRMLVKNIPNPMCIDQRGQVTTRVSSGAPLLPSPSTAFSTESEAPTRALMLSPCVTPTPVHPGFSLQPLLIQLPGGGTAIFSNSTNSQLIPMSALTTLTNSTPTHATAFILQRSTPYTAVLPTDPSASALLTHYAAALTNIPTTITAPIDMPAATTSHMTTPITTLRTTPIPLARNTPIPLARNTPITLARNTPMTQARTTTMARTTPITTSWTTPITTSRNTTIATLTTSSWVISTTTHMSTTTTTPRATSMATPTSWVTPTTTLGATTMATPTSWTTPTTTPKATTTTTSKATTTNLIMATTTPITPSCAMAKGTSNVVHLGASGTINKPSSGVSVSVCESTALVSVVYSTSSASVPRLSVPGTAVQQAVPAQLASPVEPQVPIKTGSQATNPPLDLTKTFHCTISDAFIDLTEDDDDDDDDDVLVTGVLKAPLVLKASPMPPTAGQQTTITQQTTTPTPVGKKPVRFSLDHTLAGTALEVVSHRPLQGLPSKNSKETTTTSSCQTSPIPPLPALPPTLSLPPEAVNTKPPQQPLLKLTQVQTKNDGIVLSWSVTEVDRSCAAVDCYHLYAYHQDHSGPDDTDATSSSWKKIGEVKALALPMACTLTQFVSGSKYYFAVRARDVYGRFGPFCEPQCTDVLMPTSSNV